MNPDTPYTYPRPERPIYAPEDPPDEWEPRDCPQWRECSRVLGGCEEECGLRGD